jgi:thymidylate synthase
MAEVVINDLRHGYLDMINMVMEHGEEVSPRGQLTKEVRNATVILTDPTKAIPVAVGRKLNMKIGAVETTQLIAGVSSAMQLNLVSKNAFEAYMNNGRLIGAYGPRLYHQMENVVRMICRDPDTRQAAALVWRGDETDLALLGNKDVPCTVALSWNVRHGKLNASTVMRSNDVFLGVAYDFWMFTRLQMTLAWALGLEVGDYRHHAISLHAYERDWDKVNDFSISPKEPKLPGGYTPTDDQLVTDQVLSENLAVTRWRFAREEALKVVTGDQVELSGAKWYADTLKDHAAVGLMCKQCRYFYNPDTFSYELIEATGFCGSCNPGKR